MDDYLSKLTMLEAIFSSKENTCSDDPFQSTEKSQEPSSEEPSSIMNRFDSHFQSCISLLKKLEIERASLQTENSNLREEMDEKNTRLLELSLRVQALETLVDRSKDLNEGLEDVQSDRQEIVKELEEQSKTLVSLRFESESNTQENIALKQENERLTAKFKILTDLFRNEMVAWERVDRNVGLQCGVSNIDDPEIMELVSGMERSFRKVADWSALVDETKSENQRLESSMSNLLHENKALRASLLNAQTSSASVESQLRQTIHRLTEELKAHTDSRSILEEKCAGEAEKENVIPTAVDGPPRPTAISISISAAKEKTVPEINSQLAQGRVKSLQEKFLAMTVASNSPLKENVSREGTLKRKLRVTQNSQQ